MDKSIEAAAVAYEEAFGNCGGRDGHIRGLRAAIAAYRDAEIERLTAELEEAARANKHATALIRACERDYRAKLERDGFRRDAIALEELRVVVAEIEEQDTKTWPIHGNKALAIAALYKLNHDAIDKQRAQLAARDAEIERLKEELKKGDE